ncbi:MAG: SAM dependent methyltransferase [Cenarchaeum symbiont of Oopsacas minuta]|nr:SAM dependent methyltransferase [Cenarchaeum symbiont of Oopsacas minuta]
MKIEDYIKSLPENIISGESVQIPNNALREILEFAKIGKRDIFYHLGCGDSAGPAIAAEYGAHAIGIDTDAEKIKIAKKIHGHSKATYECKNVLDADISDATIVFFWFTDEEIVDAITKKACNVKPGCKIITVWSPLPRCLPNKVQFPFMLHTAPFLKAKSLSEQILHVFGVKCIDFSTAWEHAERYTRAIQPPNAENNRLVTIIQTLIIWINAKNAKIACGDQIPEPVKSYMDILRNCYNIETRHLLN